VKAIVIARDRVSYAQQCVKALAKSTGISDIHIVDHGSTYPPMLDWLSTLHGWPTRATWSAKGIEYDGRIHVHLKPNAHPRDIWSNGTLATIVNPDERFIVTDCDIVVPTDWRGQDWVWTLGALLDARPDVVKAGLNLSLDIPDHYEHARRVREWEANYRHPSRLKRYPPQGLMTGIGAIQQPLRYFEASVDTTVAMYRRLEPFAIDPAVRTAHPHHDARHLPWYEDSANPTEEQRWYREHAMPGVSNWLDPDNYQGAHGLPAGG
jgi:hypothetical protein